jgi:peptide/nickel transport system ATP-binding protein
MNLVQVRNLRVWFPLGESRVAAVDDVNLDLAAGERLGLVGESGAGKCSLGRALIGLVPDGQVGGSICYDGEELVGLDEDRWRALRWAHLACALQQSGTAFSPVHRIGVQLGDPLVSHFGLSAANARRRIEDLAQRFQLDTALLERFPHQLSGGEKRRAMLVMALAVIHAS